MKKISLPRKKLSLAVAAALLLTAGGVVGYHVIAYDKYDDRNQSLYAQSVDSARVTLSQPKPTSEEIQKLTSELDTAAVNLCQNEPILLGVRQRIDPRATERQKVCDEQRIKLLRAKAAASVVQQYLEADSETAKIFLDTNKRLTAAKNDPGARLAAWKQAAKALDEVVPPELYAADLAAQTKAIKAIIEQYEVVSTANKAKERPKYDAARTDLAKAYGKLEEVSQDSTKTYTQHVTRLLQAVEQL